MHFCWTWTVQSSALCSKMCTLWNTYILSEDKEQDKGKRIIVVNCYYFIFTVRLSYIMNNTCLAVMCMNKSKCQLIYIAFWSLCALFAQKQLILTVDTENYAYFFSEGQSHWLISLFLPLWKYFWTFSGHIWGAFGLEIVTWSGNIGQNSFTQQDCESPTAPDI